MTRSKGEQATALLNWASVDPAKRAGEALAKVKALGVDIYDEGDPDAQPVADAGQVLSMMVSAQAVDKPA